MLGLALVLAAQGPQVFFGNLHSHTSFSDGSGTPEEAFAHPRNQTPLWKWTRDELGHAGRLQLR